MVSNFPRGSIIRQVNIEPALFFGAGRALLLQLAHPAVAQGVQDHSDFKRNPFKRLQGTVEATSVVVFGSQDLAARVGKRIQMIHRHITGPTYRANDPENLLWVHATLVDSALDAYTRLVGPLRPDEVERYYEEMTRVGEAFGLRREHQPVTYRAFRAWFDAMVERLEFTPVGRDLAGFIVRPELPFGLHRPLGPALALHRRFTLGTTPAPIREQLGVPWGPAEEARFRAAERRVRRAMGLTPRALRIAPTRLTNVVMDRQARRTVKTFERRAVTAVHP